MKSRFKCAVAASLSIALLAGSTMAADAAQFPTQQLFRSFGVRPLANNPVVLGGGATLPIPAYLGLSESSGSTNVGRTGSIFGYFASQGGGLNVEYCATGSGKGKGVFDGPMKTVDIACSNAASGSPATTFGFLPPSGSPTQTYPTLAGTDAPLAQTDYSSYIANHPSPMEPVELPSLFGSIAMYYRDDATKSAKITLTDAQICSIYTGSIKTFGQLLGNSDKTTIVPVYRADGSGTSFNFTNHLQSVCSGFGVNQTFTMADAHIPSNAFGATGNGGVVAEVKAQNGAIGYAEAGYLIPLTAGTNYANVVNGRNRATYDPITGLPAAVNPLPSSALLSNVQVNQTTSGPATTSPLSQVRSGSCVKVLAPSAYANPGVGYPIIAVTYLLTNSAMNGSYVENALRILENDVSTPSLFKHPGATTPITTADEAGQPGTTGYSSLPSTFTSTVINTARSCINI